MYVVIPKGKPTVGHFLSRCYVIFGMVQPWLIANRTSGSHDPALCDAIEETVAKYSRDIVRIISLPDDPLPDAAEAKASGTELIVIFTGDGTVSMAVDALEGWQGDLLVLPGGTMNLLSRKLHGAREPLAILEAALKPEAQRAILPVAQGHGLRSLVGIVAGPTAAWGEVREDMRQLNVGGLIESVPQALQETLQGDPVSVDGVEGEFEAVFVDPQAEGLRVNGIHAGTAAELLQHGWAWLKGDFREGPHTPLICTPEVVLRREGAFALLVDGEQAEAASPCRFTLGACPLRFIATRK